MIVEEVLLEYRLGFDSHLPPEVERVAGKTLATLVAILRAVVCKLTTARAMTVVVLVLWRKRVIGNQTYVRGLHSSSQDQQLRTSAWLDFLRATSGE